MKKEWIKPEMKNLEVEGTNTTCEVEEVETLDLEQARKRYYCYTHNLPFNSLEELNIHIDKYNIHLIEKMS